MITFVLYYRYEIALKSYVLIYCLLEKFILYIFECKEFDIFHQGGIETLK